MALALLVRRKGGVWYEAMRRVHSLVLVVDGMSVVVEMEHGWVVECWGTAVMRTLLPS